MWMKKSKKKNEDNILHSGLRAWLKEINLLEYSGKFSENGYDDLDQLRSMTGEDLAEVTSDVGLVEKKGHLKRFYAPFLMPAEPHLTCIFT